MRPRNTARQWAGNTLPQYLLAVLLLSLVAAGCENTCVGFSSNAGTGTLAISASDARSACPVSNGTVLVRLNNAGPTPGGASALPGLRHIFVSLRGIETRTGATAGDPSLNWQELAPKLARRPAQVDLLAPASPVCTSSALGEASVPAGVYRQIRLLLVPEPPAPGEPLPAENACGPAGFNCIVTASGAITPLALNQATPQLTIDSGSIDGGSFFVLPGARAELAIGFRPASSLPLPEDSAMRTVPHLRAGLRGWCQSGPQAF